MSWLLWLVLSGAAAAASVWHYRARETPGRGRLLLAALRALVFSVLFLLLLDPQLPARGGAAGRGMQVLLDASLSMRLPAAGGGTRWAEAVRRARADPGDRPILMFGDAPRAVAATAIPDSAPGDVRTRLLPALQAAAEAGVRRVRVLTDGGIEDADAIARWAPRLGLDVETEVVGADVANSALLEASAPPWVQADQPVVVDFAVAAPPADSVRVVARRDGRIVGRSVVGAPGAGRMAAGRMELQLEPPPGGGWVRLDVALERGDSVPDDDVRTVYVQMSDQPAGIVLLSLRPDWEPRFLAPVLEQALGLPLRAWLRGGTGQYVRIAGGLEAGATATEVDVRTALERAELVVLHGLGSNAPPWVAAAATSARRLLVFPAEDATGLDLPVSLGAALQGDFFPSPNIPASPLAPLLVELPAAGATPLATLRTVTDTSGTWTPLLATRGRQGAPMPVLVAGEAGGRRWAVALGSGYWQWSFRGGAERQLYTRFWSALAGWLAQERGTATLAAVRPARTAASRGEPLAWVTSGAAPDSIRVTLSDEAGQTALDTVITRSAGDTAFSAPTVPGHYRYRARAFAGGNVLEGEGVLTVERFSPELARPVVDLESVAAGTTMVRGSDARRTGRPLHATAVPYLLLVALLAAEWVLRRRWGLR